MQYAASRGTGTGGLRALPREWILERGHHRFLDFRRPEASRLCRELGQASPAHRSNPAAIGVPKALPIGFGDPRRRGFHALSHCVRLARGRRY